MRELDIEIGWIFSAFVMFVGCVRNPWAIPDYRYVANFEKPRSEVFAYYIGARGNIPTDGGKDNPKLT